MDSIWRKVAWILPRRLVYWCAIRFGAHATTGKHAGPVVSDMTYFEALERW